MYSFFSFSIFYMTLYFFLWKWYPLCTMRGVYCLIQRQSLFFVYACSSLLSLFSFFFGRTMQFNVLYCSVFFMNMPVGCKIESLMQFLHEKVLFRLYLGYAPTSVQWIFFFISLAINLFPCVQHLYVTCCRYRVSTLKVGWGQCCSLHTYVLIGHIPNVHWNANSLLRGTAPVIWIAVSKV